MIISQENIQSINAELQNSTAEDVLSYFANNINNGLCFATSLGAEDQVLTHFLCSKQLPVEIFTILTGRLFPETLQLIEETELRYQIKIAKYSPDSAVVNKMVADKGLNLFYESLENRKQCCYIRKVVPLKKALDGKKAWITGLRQEQSENRAQLEILEWDADNQLYKINPLWNWSENKVWDYIRLYNIPYNPLHDRNYRSIGCEPCTRALKPGEHPRNGRWWWENDSSKECGLHEK